MRSDGFCIASDEDLRVDALGRTYRVPPGPAPQPREYVRRHIVRWRVNDRIQNLITELVTEEDSTVAELLDDAFEVYLAARRRRVNGREG